MNDKLLKVKNVFDRIKVMRTDISGLFDNLQSRISKLTDVYNQFIKNTGSIKTQDVKIFIFSLDSFYFQKSLLDRECKYLERYYNTIINRMYGEYYKLFKLILEYGEKNGMLDTLNDLIKYKKYPKYDDLDDEKLYDFELIIQLNEDIVNVIAYLINILNDKEISLKAYIANQEYGLNVNNFVSTFNYEVIVLSEQIMLYEKYLDFFYHVHEKLLKRLITKISVLEAQLNTDIKFEGGLIGRKKNNEELFDEINILSLEKRTAKDLRHSITGSISPDSSVSSNLNKNENSENIIESVNFNLPEVDNENENNITIEMSEINKTEKTNDSDEEFLEDDNLELEESEDNMNEEKTFKSTKQKRNYKKKLRQRERKRNMSNENIESIIA